MELMCNEAVLAVPVRPLDEACATRPFRLDHLTRPQASGLPTAAKLQGQVVWLEGWGGSHFVFAREAKYTLRQTAHNHYNLYATFGHILSEGACVAAI
eukprot:1160067-Pelagomonas_calceolata.AAC.2